MTLSSCSVASFHTSACRLRCHLSLHLRHQCVCSVFAFECDVVVHRRIDGLQQTVRSVPISHKLVRQAG